MVHSKKIPTEIQLIMVQAMTGAAVICVIAYISMWLFFSLWSGITQEFPILFRVNACIFIFEAIAIYYFKAYCNKEPYSNLAQKQQAIAAYVIISGLHVGIIHTYLIYSGTLTIDEQYIIRLISTGFAGIMGSLWGIANLTGLIYAIVIILPHIPASYFLHDPNANFFTLLSCCLWFFLYICSRNIQRNSFLQFISNYRLTQVHADSMEHLSKKDIVTKVNNRFNWLINFESMWKSNLKKHETLCLIGFKINHLSEIIEAHGHKTADAIMANIASLLLQSVNNPDVLGRYSGNQFMLTMPNIEHGDAKLLASNLVHNIEEELFFPNQLCRPICLTTSVACNTQAAIDSAQSMVDSVCKDLLT